MLRTAAGAALTAVAAYPLAACDLLVGEPTPEGTTDPLAPLLTSALALAARHDAAITAHPELAQRLTPLADAHRAHAAELARMTGAKLPSASTSPRTGGAATPGAAASTPADVDGTLAALRAAEQEGRRAAAQACQVASAGRAALLGSITAARATHVEVLR